MLQLSGAWLCGLYSVPQGADLSRLRSSVCFASNKSSELEFFVPAGTHLGVKLLKPKSSPNFLAIKC